MKTVIKNYCDYYKAGGARSEIEDKKVAVGMNSKILVKNISVSGSVEVISAENISSEIRDAEIRHT